MATVTYSISGKVNQLGKSELMIRFVGGKYIVLRAKSNYFINPKRWDKKDGKVVIPRIATPEQKELAQLKEGLDKLENDILNTFVSTDKATINKTWLVSTINKHHFGEKIDMEEVNTPTLIELYNEYLGVCGLSERRKINVRVIIRALQRYSIYAQTTLYLDEIKYETLVDIEKFLRNEHIFFTDSKYSYIYELFPEKRTPQQRGQNTINDIFTKIRTFFLWAIKLDKTTNNPFKKYKIKECVYGDPIYISIDERNQLYNFDFSNRPELEIQRNIFVFQCLIGCRVGDLYKLTSANLINGSIEYIAGKTKDDMPVTVRVPLNRISREIMERHASEKGKLLPFISEQKYNNHIKTMFRLAGLDRIVTIINATTGEAEQKYIYEIASSHMARRTLIGNVYKKVKDPNLVSSLSGHKKGSKAFARYRKIDDDIKQDLMDSIE